MLIRKIEALERRMVKMMAKSDQDRSKLEPAYALVKEALDAANEDDIHKALTSMTKFNTLVAEYKLLHNV